MKRLVVCFDGTWNNATQEENGIPTPTNVVKLFNALQKTDDQLCYYHPGLGAEKRGLIQKITGGAFGAGITRHICSAYHWLGQNYEEGDEIFFFGFSRGAFTVRSIAGFLGKGLLDLSGLSSQESWKRVHKAYLDGYRKKKHIKDLDSEWTLFSNGDALPIKFLGVWDTVGALGIPDDLEILNFFDDKKKWAFHDTTLGEHVKIARHAMAIDEIRSSYTVTRWDNISSHKDVKELWFPGVHSDVGGGYAQTDLSDGALGWMIEESKAAGIVFRDHIDRFIQSNPLGIMHNSYKGIFAKLRSRPRNIDAFTAKNQSLFHQSAWERYEIPPIRYQSYHPTTILEVGDTCTVEIYAAEKWNHTGIYLERGHVYTFEASGEWKDSSDACDWKGTQKDNKRTLGDAVRSVSSLLGYIEKALKKITKNESTDILFTKRVEAFNWFVLVGAIANDGGDGNGTKNDGSPHPHQYIDMSQFENRKFSDIKSSGYLYCFANDAWNMYHNNQGSISLTIRRVR